MHFGSKTKGTAHDPAIQDLHAVSLPAVKSSASQPRLRKPPTLSSHPKPFDPDELTRKLYGVLAEQQAFAERKRRARAAIEQNREAHYAAKARAAAQQQAQSAASDAPLQDRRPGAPVLKLQTSDPTVTAAKSRRESLRRLFRQEPTSDEEPTPTYHHVPQVAASQFARTTRVESISEKALIHEFSRRTLNGRPEYPAAETDADVDLSYLDRIKSLRRSQSLKEGPRDASNTLRFSKRLDATAEADEHSSPQRLTRENLCDLLKSQGTEKSGNHMADVFQRIVASLDPPAERAGSSSRSPTSQVSPTDMKPRPDHLERVANPNEHRVDWTQSDELHKPSKQAAAQPPLRKSDSKWALKSRLSSFSKAKGDKQAASPTDEKVKDAATVASPKSHMKLGIFSRFKR